MKAAEQLNGCCKFTIVQTERHTNMCRYTHSHTYKNTLTHMYIHTHIHTHKQTHTYTYTQSHDTHNHEYENSKRQKKLLLGGQLLPNTSR